MSRFADCYPHCSVETVGILATTSPLDHFYLTDSCTRCGHIVLLHSEDRGCSACEQMNVIAACLDPMMTRIERLEGKPT